MFLKQISVTIFTIYVGIYSVRSDSLNSITENEKTNLNLNLSAALDLIIKSVNASNVRIIGSSHSFQNDFNEITDHWRTKVSMAMLNVEKKYIVEKKIQKNLFILIFMDHHFAPFLKTFMEYFGVNIRKHKIVIIFRPEECDNKRYRSLVELSSLLWANKILNFIILRYCKSIGDVHSYFPFANDTCRNFSAKNIMKIGAFYFNKSGEIFFKLEQIDNTNEFATYYPQYIPFFPNKIPLKLNKCRIIVSTGIWPPNVINVNSNEPGIEMDLILTLAHHMNAFISFIVDPNSWHGLSHDESEEHTGRLALLKLEAFDLMLGAMPAHITIFRDFETSQCYLPNSLTFIVPRAGIFPSSLILWTMLEKHTKLFSLIVAVVLFMSIAVNLMIQMTWKMNLHPKPKNSFIHNILATFLIFLRSLIDTSTPTLPQNRTIQWIYGLWFATCLIISCYFNTTLTSFFTEPGRLKQLETLQDIIDSNIQFSMDELYSPVIAADPVEVEYFKSKNRKSSVLIGLKQAAEGTAVTFTDKLRGEHIALQWVSSSGEKSIHVINGGGLNYWNNIIFYKGNIFTDRINNLVKRINQSGFWEFQKRRYYNQRLIRIMTRQYLMVYNYHHGISNEKLISQLNKDFRDTSDSNVEGMGNETEKFMVETDEQDIIQRFVRTDKTLVTWDHLSTVFRLWAIGMSVAGIVFICERLLLYVQKIN